MYAQGNRSAPDARKLRAEAGAWLKKLREDAGLTQRDLAEKVGFKYYTFVSQIEGGTGRVPSECYRKYADALGIGLKKFGIQMLRFYDPFAFEAIFGSSQGRRSRASGGKVSQSMGSEQRV